MLARELSCNTSRAVGLENSAFGNGSGSDLFMHRVPLRLTRSGRFGRVSSSKNNYNLTAISREEAGDVK